MRNMEETKKEKLSIAKRIDAFFDKNYALIFAPFIVVFLYVFALWQYGVYPFGTKYTAASYDLSAQICPFIEHLFDVFDGKSTLTFSYAIVGGADVTGTFLYFFISPFSFLFLIFGDGKVAHASSIVMACKLAAIAFSGTWFAQKVFHKIPDYLCIVVGILYAYCGYSFVANTYINWMDFLIYLPFAAAAFKHFVKTEKFLPFSILVGCCIYTCFSIACFSMFTVFPALIAYALFCVEKEKKHRFIAYLCLSFVVAVLIALPVLLPALGAYSVSGRGGSLFEGIWYGFKVNSQTSLPENFNSSDFIKKYSETVYAKWSYILSDSIFVVLTLVWFYRKGLKDGFARFMLVTGVLILLPTLVDESMKLLNMGSYMSYALRFGFLSALYFLGGACLCLEGVCFTPCHTYAGKNMLAENEGESEKKGGMSAFTAKCKDIFRKENKDLLLWSGILVGVGVIATAFLIWFINGDHYKTILKLFNMDTYSASAFAHSLGGMEVICIFFFVVAVVALVGSFLVGEKKISPFLLSVVMIVLLSPQIAFYSDQMVYGNRSTQHTAYENYRILSEELNARDDSYFRVKDYGYEKKDGSWDTKVTACIPFTAGCNSFSVFSSVIDKDNFATYQLFGYLGNGKNSYKSAQSNAKYNRSDEFGDSFLGYKYYFVPKASKSHAEEKSYLTPVWKLDETGAPVLNEKGEKVQLSQGDFYVYENTIVFPLGYRVQQGGYTFVSPNESNSSYRKNNQKALYQFLRGEDLKAFTGSEVVTPKSATELSKYLWGKSASVQVSAGKITAQVRAEAGESLLLNFVASDGYTVTVNGKKTELVDNDLKFLLVNLEEGENTVEFVYSSPYVKHMAVGAVGAVVGLCAVVFVVKRTKLVEACAPVISWAGIVLSLGVVAFFMLFPTGVLLSKVVELLKGFIL